MTQFEQLDLLIKECGAWRLLCPIFLLKMEYGSDMICSMN